MFWAHRFSLLETTDNTTYIETCANIEIGQYFPNTLYKQKDFDKYLGNELRWKTRQNGGTKIFPDAPSEEIAESSFSNAFSAVATCCMLRCLSASETFAAFSFSNSFSTWTNIHLKYFIPCFKEHSDLGVEATTLRRNFFLRDKNINGNVNILKAGMKGGKAIDFSICTFQYEV